MPTRNLFLLQTSSGPSGQWALVRIVPVGQNSGGWLGLDLACRVEGKGSACSPYSPESGDDSGFSHADGVRPHGESGGLDVGF